MKVAALAALGMFIIVPAHAAQQQPQYVSSATTCDNDGHCTTLATKPAVHRIRPKAARATAAVVPQLPQPRPVQAGAQPSQDSQSRPQESQQSEQPQDQQE